MSARMLRATVGAVSAACKTFENRLVTAKARRLLAAAAMAVMLAPAGAANAVTVTGTFKITYTPIKGNSPSFSNPSSSSGARLITGSTTNNKYVDGSNYDIGYFSVNLDPNGAASPTVNFFQINPSSTCGSSCPTGTSYPSGHKDYYYTQSGTVNVVFDITSATEVSGTDETATGLYQARYGGPILSCASTANSPAYGDTDCINWNNDPNPIKIAFTNGQTLIITLKDAEDWSIRPQINFKLISDPIVTPIPGALPLFVSGMGVFGYVGWRRKKRAEKASGVTV
ncbi:MAG: hypothetical protein ACRD5Z_21605 [Bryobacteraceae bacterium]